MARSTYCVWAYEMDRLRVSDFSTWWLSVNRNLLMKHDIPLWHAAINW